MKIIVETEALTYAWLKPDAPSNPAERSWEDLDIVFDRLDLSIPEGVTSVTGPNGVGKTTLLLLLGGRLQAHEGMVSVLGHNTAIFKSADQDPSIEQTRSQLVGFVYQNMEFETEHSLAQILDAMDPTGLRANQRAEIVEQLDLGLCLAKQPQAMAKGELQRAVMAMALYWASPLVIMDEPVFALEDDRKRKIFAWLKDYCHRTSTSLIFTAHDLDLCRDFADNCLLLWREADDVQTLLGPASEVCSQNNLERAWKAPLSTLYQKERLYRDMLKQEDHR